MTRGRFYVASDNEVRGPMSKSLARIAQVADPAAHVFAVSTASLPRIAGAWMAFHHFESREHARRRFLVRYGYGPARIVEAGPLLLVGPIGENLGEREAPAD